MFEATASHRFRVLSITDNTKILRSVQRPDQTYEFCSLARGTATSSARRGRRRIAPSRSALLHVENLAGLAIELDRHVTALVSRTGVAAAGRLPDDAPAGSLRFAQGEPHLASAKS